MKLFLKLCFCILAVTQFTKAFAADPGIYCLENSTGEWMRLGSGNFTTTRLVNVGAEQFPSAGVNNRDRIFALTPVFIQCRNSFEDNANYNIRLSLVTRSTTNYSPAVIQENTVVYAYTNSGGSFDPTQNNRYNFDTRLPPRNSLGTAVVEPSIAFYRRTVGTNINTVLPAGTFIGTLRFTVLRNNVLLNGQELNVQLYTTNDKILQPETCVINNDQPLEVDLGTIAEVEIPVGSGLNSGLTRTLDLNYRCEDVDNSRMRVQLVGQPSTFSTNAVETRTGNVYGTGEPIQHLGVEFYKDTIVLAPNSVSGFITQITNGVGSDTLTIAPVKSAEANSVNLPSGYFNSTATLVFTIP
jgi:hypothetical protein